MLSGKPEEPDLSIEELFNHVEHLRPDKLEPYGREVSTQKTVSIGSLQTVQEQEWEEFAEFDEELYGDFDLMDNVVPLHDSEKNMLLSEEFKTELLSEGTTLKLNHLYFFRSNFLHRFVYFVYI